MAEVVEEEEVSLFKFYLFPISSHLKSFIVTYHINSLTQSLALQYHNFSQEGVAEGVEVVEEDIWEAEVEAASVDVDVEGVEVVVSVTSDLYSILQYHFISSTY